MPAISGKRPRISRLLTIMSGLSVFCGLIFVNIVAMAEDADAPSADAPDIDTPEEQSVLVSSRQAHRSGLPQSSEPIKGDGEEEVDVPLEPISADQAQPTPVEPTPAGSVPVLGEVPPAKEAAIPARSNRGTHTTAHGAKTRSDGAKTRSDGAKTRSDGAKARSDGAQTRSNGAQMQSDGAQMQRDGAKTRRDGVKRRQEEKKTQHNRVAEVAKKPVQGPVELPSAEAAKFHGVQPGTTTVEDLLADWGDPRTESKQAAIKGLVYHVDPFKQVTIHAANGLVSDIQILLKKPLAPSLLAKQLHLDDIRPVVVRDAAGEPLGAAFPERGVSMTFAPNQSSPHVSHVLLEPINAEPFLLRAESDLHGPYAANIGDLRMAVKLDSESAHARWLLAEVYLATGQPTRAEVSAAAALAIAPKMAAYRLRWARAMEALGRYERAAQETKSVIEGKAPSYVKAQAVAQLGRMAALGSPDDAKKAVPLFNRAIKEADKLATSEDPAVRRTSKELLIDGHLAVAEQIALGDWRKKSTVVPQWIGRASAFAEEMIETDDGSLELRLRVAEHALAALSSFQPMPDPTGWVREAQQTADQLLKETDDKLRKQRIHWQLGMAYFHALHIAHVRGDAPTAHKLGRLALFHLSMGAQSRQALPMSEHFVGRLYFRIGAVYAIHDQDPAKAVAWYDKATPLMQKMVPVSSISRPCRHGDALVSMGISYWKVGKQELGLELTERGADILAQAADNGLVELADLTVAYGNLASMHKELGNSLEASQYMELARGSKRDGATRK